MFYFLDTLGTLFKDLLYLIHSIPTYVPNMSIKNGLKGHDSQEAMKRGLWFQSRERRDEKFRIFWMLNFVLEQEHWNFTIEIPFFKFFHGARIGSISFPIFKMSGKHFIYVKRKHYFCSKLVCKIWFYGIGRKFCS